VKLSSIKEDTDTPSATEMIKRLVDGQEAVVQRRERCSRSSILHTTNRLLTC